MDLRGELEALYRANGGRLTAAAVVEAARPENSPLHSQFEWNDEEAAEKYRLTQARALIRRVKISYVTKDDEVAKAPMFVSVAQSDATHAYMKTEEVMHDPVLTRIVLQDAIRQWRALYARYQHLEGFRNAVRASFVPTTPSSDEKALG